MASAEMDLNLTYNRSLDFAVRIVRLCNYLQEEKRECTAVTLWNFHRSEL